MGHTRPQFTMWVKNLFTSSWTLCWLETNFYVVDHKWPLLSMNPCHEIIHSHQQIFHSNTKRFGCYSAAFISGIINIQANHGYTNVGHWRRGTSEANLILSTGNVVVFHARTTTSLHVPRLWQIACDHQVHTPTPILGARDYCNVPAIFVSVHVYTVVCLYSDYTTDVGCSTAAKMFGVGMKNLLVHVSE